MTIAAAAERRPFARPAARHNGLVARAVVIFSLMAADAGVFTAVDYFLRAFNADPEFVLSYQKPIADHFSRFDLVFFIALIFIAMRYLFGDYSRRQLFLDGARTTTRALLVATIPFATALLLSKPATSILPAAIGWGALFVAIPWGRQFMRLVLSRVGYWLVPTAVVGMSADACEVCGVLADQLSLGFDVRWMVGDKPCSMLPDSLSHLQVLTRAVEDVVPLLTELRCGQVIFVPDESAQIQHNEIIDLLIGANIGVAIVPSIRKLPLFGLSANYFFGKDMLLLQARNNLARLPQRILKRGVDLIGSALLLVVIVPLFAVMGVLIKLDDGGPVFFVQNRVGRNRRDFPCWKFRTMVVDAENQFASWEHNAPALLSEYRESNFKLQNDPRVTRVGAWLRKTSLDELPQLINVLRGEMSLVGPRPLLRRELDDYGRAITLYEHVRPGITGLWQINGRSETKFMDRVSYDEWYIKNWTLWYDIVILLQTARVLAKGRGAY